MYDYCDYIAISFSVNRLHSVFIINLLNSINKSACRRNSESTMMRMGNSNEPKNVLIASLHRCIEFYMGIKLARSCVMDRTNDTNYKRTRTNNQSCCVEHIRKKKKNMHQWKRELEHSVENNMRLTFELTMMCRHHKNLARM